MAQKNRTEESQARQQIVHDRRDGEDPVDITAIEQNEFAELVGEPEQARDENQHREDDRRDDLRAGSSCCV